MKREGLPKFERGTIQRGLPQRVAAVTPEEYLDIERTATYRSEYFRGEIFAMAGGSAKHSRIRTNVISLLNVRLNGTPCTTFDSDLRIKCPTGLYTYPDASVVCGNLEFDDEHQDTVLNPTLLVEVFSKSSEACDRGKKFDHYRTILSIREYVLVSQDEPMVQCFVRNGDGTWTLSVASSLEQNAKIHLIGIDLLVASIYDRVDFTTDTIAENT